jgi:hypothetical protein
MNRCILAAIAVIAIAVTGCASGSPSATTAETTQGTASSAPVATSSSAQPETEAGVRSTATAFYALYAAGQWDDVWEDLTPSAQKAAPQATFVAVHNGCPSPSAGMARVIKSVTLVGSTAVVTETIAGAASAIGTAADAWDYVDGRWGFQLSASSLAVYTHGSTAADIAAAKAAGECAGS